MLRKCLLAALVLSALHASPVLASSDMDCSRGDSTDLKHNGYDACASMPFLNPANDSRLNLQLLLIDNGKLSGRLDKPQLGPETIVPPVPFLRSDWQVFPAGTPVPAAASSADGDGDATDSNSYAEGEGSRCRSADHGADAFQYAVQAAKDLPASEAAALLASRRALTPNCQGASASPWIVPTGIHSSSGLQFAAYIAGANAFYAGAFDSALKVFDVLSESPDPWLRETARYMVGRTQLNSAQASAFGDWGGLDQSKVDKPALGAADSAFKSYLHDFPQGRYAASAQGLLRRVYWLGADQTQLAEAYEQALAQVPSSTLNITSQELIQEADDKLLTTAKPDAIKSPQLLAIIDLMQMRPHGSDSASGAEHEDQLTLDTLQAQKERFAGNPALYSYLLAAFHIYVDKNPQQALSLLPATPGTPLNYFAFSQQTLRGFALENSGRDAEAQQLWKQLLPLAKQPLQHEQLELALAMNQEHAGQVDQVFAADSPVKDDAIRSILLEHTASAELLRRQIKAPGTASGVRDAALYTLLYKELTRGHYQDFQADLALLPAAPSKALAPFAQAANKGDVGYACPSLREVAATLQQHPEDGKSLNCLGELVRIHDVHYGQDGVPAANSLGGAPSQFPGAVYERMGNYLKVMSKDSADRPAHAYALFRAINCYAPAGDNGCGGPDVPKSVRKQWFQSLKTDHADSEWAQQLKYYW